MQIVDILSYEGDNQTFVWKHPREDFNTGSQLIVHESQEAVFFLNGQALDLFGPGRYELTTQNIPFLRKLINIPTNGQTPFHAEVYFVNKVSQLGIPWGTSSKVQFMEPTYGFPLSLGASGELGVSVADSRKLLVKVVGTEAVLSQDALIRSMKSYLQVRIKNGIASSIAEQKFSIFELDSHLEELSETLRYKLATDLEPWGLSLPQLAVTTIVRPDGDRIYEQFKDLYFRQFADVRAAQIEQQVGVIEQETRAKRTVIEAQAIAEKRTIEGYTYQQERSFDVANRLASNEGIGEFSNLGIGMGMISAIGAPMAGTVGNAMASAMSPLVLDSLAPTGLAQSQSTDSSGSRPKFCPECGRPFGETEKFCPECGTKRG